MKQFIFSMMAIAACGTVHTYAQQLPNIGFDTWKTCKAYYGGGNYEDTGTDPEGWNGSNVYQANQHFTGLVTEGSDGDNKYAVLTNSFCGFFKIGAVAPGYLTLGTPWSYAKTQITTIKEADGGTFGGMTFTNHPDAISFKYKSVRKTDENASVIAYLWKGSFSGKQKVGYNGSEETMVDRDSYVLGTNTNCTPSADAKLIASINTSIEGEASEWTSKTIDFDYKNSETPEKVNLIFCAGNYFGDRKDLGENNSLSIDDVKFVYYHSLSDITYDGKSISKTSDASDTDYSLTVNGKFDASKISYTKKGQGATVTSKAVNEHTYQLIVTAEDYDATTNTEAQTTYTIHIAEATDYTNDMLVAVTAGSEKQYTVSPNVTVQLVKESDGSKTFKLNNFILGTGKDALGVGNIEITNLTQEGNTYKASKNISITAGDDPSIAQDEWFGPILGEIPVSVNASVNDNQMIANITIDIRDTFDQYVEVSFAPTISISDDASVQTIEGTANVILTRTFKKGWNTICLPFSTTAEALGATKVQMMQNCSDGMLNFTSFDGDMLENTPYLIYFAEEKPFTSDNPFVYTGDVVSSETLNTITSGGITMIGNYKHDFPMNGYYGVADQDGVQRIMSGGTNATLGPCRAYFIADNVLANGMLISFDGQTTGITSAELNKDGAAEDAPIYNLQGVRVSHLQKGVYIKGGKKFVVK